jgi:hypothetical protein
MRIEELAENWNYYEHRKREKNEDVGEFLCMELWEVNFLIDKIRLVYKNIPEEKLRSAITSCCIELKSPSPRKKFVNCVIERLGLK